MASYYIWTVGCQMNKADSERIRGLLESWGMGPAQDMESADTIVLNSCVVREKAENRVLSKMGSLKALKKERPDVSIIVTGCLVEGGAEDLQGQYPYVDAFFRAGQFSEIVDWGLQRGFSSSAFRGSTPASNDSPTAYVPIIEGCDNFCSYCIVPYRRGREKSRPFAEIVGEVRGLAGRSVKEVTLVGQNVDSYGHDLPDRPDLAGLLSEMNNIDGMRRLRFLTSHPKDMTTRLIETIPALDKVCEHINLPAQSGNDEILKAMRRGYGTARYRELIGEIRRAIPRVALSTDVIVGFPGETEDQFLDTYNLIEEIRFDTVHVAAYSPRPGTLAARSLKDDVPDKVKKLRLSIIENLQTEISGEINSGLVGHVVEVLIEKLVAGKWMGRTRTGKLVFLKPEDYETRPGTDLRGELAAVKIARASPWSMAGELVTEANCVTR